MSQVLDHYAFFVYKEMFADGRLFLRCTVFLFSVSIMPKSVIHSGAEEGGHNDGSPVREENVLDKGGL